MLKRLVFPTMLAFATIACSDAAGVLEPDVPQHSMVIAGGAAPSSSAANYEIKFMEGMIDHHMMAVMTAEVCLDAAVHAELLAMCQNIITTQTQEIQTMQAWLSDWYGIAYQPMMSHGMMKGVERLSALNGQEFEVAFMEMMIQHHEGAIREAGRCVRKAYHSVLVELCEDISAAQSAEIAQLEMWLCAWYGHCKQEG